MFSPFRHKLLQLNKLFHSFNTDRCFHANNDCVISPPCRLDVRVGGVMIKGTFFNGFCGNDLDLVSYLYVNIYLYIYSSQLLLFVEEEWTD